MRGVLKILVCGCFVSLLGLTSCTDDEPADSQKKPVSTDAITLEPTQDIYKSWEEFYSKDDLSFSIDSFEIADTISGELYTTAANLSDSFFQHYGKLIIYNADSSKFIDPLSYSLIIEKDKRGQLHARGGEVDHEVSVVDIAKKTKTRLLFCGPSCEIQKAFWYNENIVGIMGLTSEYTDEYYTPMIWFVNINNGVTIPYEYHSSISIIDASDFLKNYIESKGIEMAN